jgi:hypothetical protein
MTKTLALLRIATFALFSVFWQSIGGFAAQEAYAVTRNQK